MSWPETTKIINSSAPSLFYFFFSKQVQASSAMIVLYFPAALGWGGEDEPGYGLAPRSITR